MKGFVDDNLVLSDAQTITTCTNSSTNHIRLPNTTVGEGRPMYLHVAVDTAFDAATGAVNIAIALYDSADDSTFAATEIAAAAMAETALDDYANTELYRWPLPSDTKEYIMVLYTLAGGAMTAGSFDAWVGYH